MKDIAHKDGPGAGSPAPVKGLSSVAAKKAVAAAQYSL